MTTKHVLFAAGACLLALSPLMAAPGGNGGKGGPDKAEKGKGGGDKGHSDKGGPDQVEKAGGKPEQTGKADHGGSQAGHAGKDFAKHARGSFRDEDYPLLRGFFEPFRDEPGHLPPGIAKRLRDGKGLPEGWRDQFVPGGLLGDRYWDAMVPLPDDMRRRLSRGDDSRYYLIDGQLVRIHPTERRVMGLISLVDLLIP
jgi:hypothetical protein